MGCGDSKEEGPPSARHPRNSPRRGGRDQAGQSSRQGTSGPSVPPTGGPTRRRLGPGWEVTAPSALSRERPEPPKGRPRLRKEGDGEQPEARSTSIELQESPRVGRSSSQGMKPGERAVSREPKAPRAPQLTGDERARLQASTRDAIKATDDSVSTSSGRVYSVTERRTADNPMKSYTALAGRPNEKKRERQVNPETLDALTERSSESEGWSATEASRAPTIGQTVPVSESAGRHNSPARQLTVDEIFEQQHHLLQAYADEYRGRMHANRQRSSPTGAGEQKDERSATPSPIVGGYTARNIHHMMYHGDLI